MSYMYLLALQPYKLILLFELITFYLTFPMQNHWILHYLQLKGYLWNFTEKSHRWMFHVVSTSNFMCKQSMLWMFHVLYSESCVCWVMCAHRLCIMCPSYQQSFVPNYNKKSCVSALQSWSKCKIISHFYYDWWSLVDHMKYSIFRKRFTAPWVQKFN